MMRVDYLENDKATQITAPTPKERANSVVELKSPEPKQKKDRTRSAMKVQFKTKQLAELDSDYNQIFEFPKQDNLFKINKKMDKYGKLSHIKNIIMHKDQRLN